MGNQVINEPHYYAWIKTGCPYCTKARDEFITQKVSHTLMVMDDHLERLDEMKQKFNWKTVPLIIKSDADGTNQLIGGYTDLVRHFNEGE